MRTNSNAKDKFIETACRLFEVNGYNATGLNEILKESGAPKGSLYYHFPNGKEELALEAIKLAGDKITTNIKRALNEFEDASEAFIANLRNIANIIDDDNKMKDMSISLLALETYSSSEILRTACEKTFASIEKIYIDKLVASGINEQKAKELSMTISAMMEGAIMLSLTRKSGDTLRILGKQIELLIKK